jgi:hypothetical protein
MKPPDAKAAARQQRERAEAEARWLRAGTLGELAAAATPAGPGVWPALNRRQRWLFLWNLARAWRAPAEHAALLEEVLDCARRRIDNPRGVANREAELVNARAFTSSRAGHGCRAGGGRSLPEDAEEGSDPDGTALLDRQPHPVGRAALCRRAAAAGRGRERAGAGAARRVGGGVKNGGRPRPRQPAPSRGRNGNPSCAATAGKSTANPGPHRQGADHR